MKGAAFAFTVLAVVAFSIWLFYQEEAASPGPRIDAHARTTTCKDCHTPFRGVDSRSCLECHVFDDYFAMRPAVRFHEAGQYCTACHTEHRGAAGDISRMDHTLLHADLMCSDCHLDPHRGLFGQQCRQCHGLSTWTVRGFEHPPIERRNCIRCHRPPLSHSDETMFQRLRERHAARTGNAREISMEACWECHVIHDWRHLRM
jgi:hypothetical protein